MNRKVNYEELINRLTALTEDVPYPIANLANAAALLWEALPDINWAGFYMMEDGALVLGPFQGKTACIRIAVGRGVCGTAVAEDRTQLVPDVHAFPGHIACDSASRSEIVVPIHHNGEVIAVLDIDSADFDRFHENEQKYMELICKHLEEQCDWEY